MVVTKCCAHCRVKGYRLVAQVVLGVSAKRSKTLVSLRGLGFGLGVRCGIWVRVSVLGLGVMEA